MVNAIGFTRMSDHAGTSVLYGNTCIRGYTPPPPTPIIEGEQINSSIKNKNDVMRLGERPRSLEGKPNINNRERQTGRDRQGLTHRERQTGTDRQGETDRD